MLRTRVVTNLCVWLIAALAVPIFFCSPWFKPIPPVATYNGKVSFQGDRAFRDLEVLVSDYLGRSSGTLKAKTSADWVMSQFASMGLDAFIEEFLSRTLPYDLMARGRQTTSVRKLIQVVPGYNVIAVSPGETPDTIIIGAHRDVVGNIQGAEDNGSGTAALLELARVLPAENHKYTYVFVSFDSEEAGLIGSRAFVQSHKDMPVKLAICLDMVGFAGSDTVAFYSLSDRGHTAPLWTAAVGKALLDDAGLPEIGVLNRPKTGPVQAFRSMFFERTSASASTDSAPFIDARIPAVGIRSERSGHGASTAPGVPSYRQIHSEKDVIGQISPDCIEMVGRFTERYVKSLELNSFEGALKSNAYILAGDSFLSPGASLGFSAFSITLIVGLAVLAALEASAKSEASGSTAAVSMTALVETLRGFGRFLRREWVIVASGVVTGLVASLIPLLMNQGFFGSWSINKAHFAITAVTFGAALAVSLLRRRSLRNRKDDADPIRVSEYQRLLIAFTASLAFLTVTSYSGVFAALLVAAPPALLMGRVTRKPGYNLAALIIALLTWGIPITMNTRGRLMLALIVGDPRVVPTLFVQTGLFVLTAVYVLTGPATTSRS